jgi:hypothetical protein
VLKRTVLLALCLWGAAISTADAFDRRAKATLLRLDPETRQVQACDLAAMERINKDRNPYHPDRVMLDYLAPPKKNDDLLQGSGAVFRSRGSWYRLSFKCKTSKDRMSVLSFSYTVGSKIDRADWDRLNLFP